MTKAEAIAMLKRIQEPEAWEPQINQAAFEALDMAIKALEEPERKKGEWIEISLISHSYKCSVCGRLLVNITDGKNNVAKNYPYCHCGADMRGE